MSLPASTTTVVPAASHCSRLWPAPSRVCYYGLLQVLESLGMRAVEIPTSPRTGMSLEALEMAVQAYGNIRAVVVVPNLRNPLGSIMPGAAKRRMAAFCEAHRIALIEDDTCSPLADSPAPLKALKAWDRTGNVIYCASLSKTLAPGLDGGGTLARARADAEVRAVAAERFVVAGAGGAFHCVGRVWPAYPHAAPDAARAARTHGQVDCRVLSGRHAAVGAGGRLGDVPANVSSTDLFDAAPAHGIRIAPGTMFSNLNRFDHYFRICFGLSYTANLEAEQATLGQLTRQLADT